MVITALHGIVINIRFGLEPMYRPSYHAACQYIVSQEEEMANYLCETFKNGSSSTITYPIRTLNSDLCWCCNNNAFGVGNRHQTLRIAKSERASESSGGGFRKCPQDRELWFSLVFSPFFLFRHRLSRRKRKLLFFFASLPPLAEREF
ncbi:hypothetical protein VNO77_22953 [Canavalia gladiata]|uniref:Uncharacterized protein n=1 Tax=Canavalia gladiata TaxID=3824 RepID=A0AAN9L428_CANGL